MRNKTYWLAASWGGLALWYLLTARPAFAYLDPGTGSYMLQILIAGIVGALFVIKPFFARIQELFRKIFVRECHEERPPE